MEKECEWNRQRSLTFIDCMSVHWKCVFFFWGGEVHMVYETNLSILNLGDVCHEVSHPAVWIGLAALQFLEVKTSARSFELIF